MLDKEWSRLMADFLSFWASVHRRVARRSGYSSAVHHHFAMRSQSPRRLVPNARRLKTSSGRVGTLIAQDMVPIFDSLGPDKTLYVATVEYRTRGCEALIGSVLVGCKEALGLGWFPSFPHARFDSCHPMPPLYRRSVRRPLYARTVS